MPTVTAFVRISGALQPQFGPSSFSEDWAGVFTATEIMDVIEKFSIQPGHALENVAQVVANWGTDAPRPDSIGQQVGVAKMLQMLDRAELLLSEINHIQISSEVARFGRGSSMQCRFVLLSATQGKRPPQIVEEALLDMGCVGWGYLNQICLALIAFMNERGDRGEGHRGMSIFFKN